MRWRLVLAVASTAGLLTTLGAEAQAEQANLVGSGDSQFVITGTPVTNLHPGAIRLIETRFANPNRFPIEVYSVKAELTDTSKRGCKPIAKNVEVGPYNRSLPFVVDAGRSRARGQIEVYMPNTVAEACQLAKFTFKLTGKARKAGR